jgi:hypothetical protein
VVTVPSASVWNPKMLLLMSPTSGDSLDS